MSALLHLPLVQKKYGPLLAFSKPCVAVNPITRFRGGAVTYKLFNNLFIFQYRGRLRAVVHHISRTVLDTDAMRLVLGLLLNPRGGSFQCADLLSISSYSIIQSVVFCIPTPRIKLSQVTHLAFPPRHTIRCRVWGVYRKCSLAQTFAYQNPHSCASPQRIRLAAVGRDVYRPINHFYTFLPIKYVLVISCFIAMHCSCVSKNCNLMSLGLV